MNSKRFTTVMTFVLGLGLLAGGLALIGPARYARIDSNSHVDLPRSLDVYEDRLEMTESLLADGSPFAGIGD